MGPWGHHLGPAPGKPTLRRSQGSALSAVTVSLVEWLWFNELVDDA